MMNPDENIPSVPPAEPQAAEQPRKKQKKRRGSFGRFLRRTLLVVVTALLLTVAGAGLLLNTVLTGPSPTARDLLTATLCQEPATGWIPGLFLDQALVDQILSRSGAPLRDTVTDPARIVFGADPEIWQDCPDGIRQLRSEGDTYTAHLLLIRDPAQITLGTSQDGHAALSVESSSKDNAPFAGFTADGVLVLRTSGTAEQPEAPEIRAGGPCDLILILNGMVNHEVYNANSGICPRSALGQRADGTVIFLYLEGWTADSPGGTYRDLTDLLVKYGAVNGCSLDAGADCSFRYRDADTDAGVAGKLITFANSLVSGEKSPAEPAFWLVSSPQED